MDTSIALKELLAAVGHHQAVYERNGLAYASVDAELWNRAAQLREALGLRIKTSELPSAANEADIAKQMREHPDVPDAVREEWNVD